MEVKIPEPGTISAEISQIDLNDISESTANDIKSLIYQYRLVVFRDQELSDEAYIAFAKMLGKPQIYFQDQYHHPEHPEIFVSSNMRENSRKVGVPGTGRYWHTDCAF